MKTQTTSSVYWRLRFRFYQYNDGSSNNGHYRRCIEFTDEAEAIKARDAIQKAILAGEGKASVGMEGSDPELSDYIPGCCGGYYTWCELFRVDYTESPLGYRVAGSLNSTPSANPSAGKEE